MLCRRMTLAALATAVAGCGGTTPQRVPPPMIDAAAATGRAMATYDQDHDQALSAAECAASPALAAAFARLDADASGRIAAEELSRRISAWKSVGMGRVSCRCRVTLDGKPLEGAVIEAVPEAFLGAAWPVASGTTDAAGVASLAAKTPEVTAGLPCGFYTLKIHKQTGGKDLPAKYHDQSKLGVEVAAGVPEIYPLLDLALKRK